MTAGLTGLFMIGISELTWLLRIAVGIRWLEMRFRGFLREFFLLTEGILPLINGNALLEEFVESFGLREIYQ